MSLIDLFFDAENELTPDNLEGSANELIQTWIERWEEGQGPAFLPRLQSGRLYWYGLMDDAPQRRELQELLHHWVGPSCSDIARNRGSLDPDDAFDARLADELPARVTRLEVLPRLSEDKALYDQNRQKVRRRLERLVSILDTRPEIKTAGTRGLGTTLDDVYLRASQGDLEGANELVSALERRRLIDAPNTAFVRLRAMALAGDDAGALVSQELRDLDGQELPRAFANLIASSWARMNEQALVAGDVQSLRQSTPPYLKRALRQASPVAGSSAAHALELLETGATATDTAQTSLIADPAATFAPATSSSEAVTSPREPDAEAPMAPDTTETGLTDTEAFAMWQGGRHEDLVNQVVRAPSGASLDTFSFAVFAARSLGTDAAANSMLGAIESSLGPPGDVRWTLPGTDGAVRELTLRRQQTVYSWTEWFDAAESNITLPLPASEEAVDWEPLSAEDFVDRVLSVSAEAILPVLGAMLARHRPFLSPDQRAQVALPLLEALSVSGRSGRDVRAASFMLVGDLLEVDLEEHRRAELLEIVELLIDQQLSAASVAWSLDVLSEVVDALAGPAFGELQNLLSGLLNSFTQLGATLRRQDAEMLSSVLAQVGLELPGHIETLFAEAEEEDPLACLSGKRILVYSLRERSARQAQARLQRLPGTDVILNHEHAGSTKLGGQVEGADIVVIVTAAAKHAATDFIEERVTGTKLLVNSAGFSALIAALEDHCAA